MKRWRNRDQGATGDPAARVSTTRSATPELRGSADPEIFYPGTLAELLQIRRRHEKALVYAGGTYFVSQRAGRFVQLPSQVISLQDVEEIRRISRSERFIEIGAATPLLEILKLGHSHIPDALRSAITHIGPPAIGGLATLGGNLAIPGRLMTSTPVLALMDARAELRRQGSSRWVPVIRLHRADGSLELAQTEVIARIRVPLFPWDVQEFRRFGSELAPESNPLSFCGLAQIGNGIVEEIRIVGSAGQRMMLRNKEVEADLVGRRLPLAEREIRATVDAYGGVSQGLNPIQRDRFHRLIQWFLLTLKRTN